ncbi:hypothetical protein ACHAWX_003970 [Stephanocyclus meneghinianus]
MEEFCGPPPSAADVYDNTNDDLNHVDHGKFQDCVPSLQEHHLDNSQLPLHNDDANHVIEQQAVHAAMDAASAAPTESLPTFAELDGPLSDSQENTNLNQESDAFLEGHDHDEPYAHPYTSTSVPVPPMMDWDHAAQHDNGQVQVHLQTQAPANPIGNAMELHSPIVSASAEPLHAPNDSDADAVDASLPPNNHNHHRNDVPHASEPIYTSYAIAPGPPPHPHHHHHHTHHPHAMPPHPSSAPHAHYDPHPPPHSIYAHYPTHAYAMPPPQAPTQGQIMAPYAAVAAIPTKPNPNHNSNFWLQEEEERFLLGLRLYGWGQWKRIQTIVQTRSNKQIKSHAQKREKVNPEIKFKYAKGKSRRGRISSKVLATEYAAGMPEQEALAAAAAASSLNDPRLPPMEELWKDVYGTNNGVGPNSRLRRYRSNALHQKWLEEVADKPQAEQVPQPLATEKKLKSPVSSESIKQDKAAASTSASKKKLTPEGQYIHDHKVLERHAMAPPQQHQQQPSPGPPMSYYNAPPPTHGHPYPPHPNYAMPPPGVSPTRMHHPGPAYPPPGYPPGAMGHHPPMPPPRPGAHPPVIHHGNATAATAPHNNAQGNGLVVSNEEPLRPGMRVYARNKNSPLWWPGVIYSAKVDPNKSIDPNQATVPLLYHVQYDGGEEDPEVQEEYIVGKAKYEKALNDLETYYDLSSMGRAIRPAPLEGGLPVYAQWMERSNPTSHARWLPGTIDSVRSEDTPHGTIYTYHILFDNAAEKSDVPSECVLDRNEYHELVKHKHPPSSYTQADSSQRTPVDEIYMLFSRGDANATASGQGMDLLFTASQMAAPMDTLKKRDASSMMNGEEEGGGDGAVDGGDPSSKRVKTEREEQQQERQQLLATQLDETFAL